MKRIAGEHLRAARDLKEEILEKCSQRPKERLEKPVEEVAGPSE